jgi:ribosomal protein S18 acetylase RimI-like enzyme
MPLNQPQTITIRPATRDDVDRLFAIHRAALKSYVDATWGWDDDWQADYFREHFDTSIRHVICCAADDIGFLDVMAQPDAIILQNIEIDPDYHGRGIGTELIRRVLTDADNNGIPVRLQVLKVNSRARDLYERLGFVPVGQTDTHCQMERPYAA